MTRETRLSYDARGLVTTVREPSTQTVTNAYDARGRLTRQGDVDNTFALANQYDANNNRTSVAEGGRTNFWTYDAYDRVSTCQDAEGNLMQYRYDAAGNLTNLVYPGGKNVYYAYDTLNRLTNVTDWASRKTSIEYDLASRVKKITRLNGTQRSINYDTAGQATSIIEQTTSGNAIAYFKLGWNDAGRMAWEFGGPLPHAYTPPSWTIAYDDDNRIQTFNSQAVTHDLDGNMTSGPLTNSTFASYSYDVRNRLLSAGGISYAYDPAGNRVGLTNGASVTRFIINPNAALSQVLVRSKNGVTNYCVYGLGLLYEITVNTNGTETATNTYHYDYRGSTIAITRAGGVVTDRMEYSAYGMLTYRAGTTDTPFLFNGRYGVLTDPNGLLYMRARYYNSFLCRFANPDPVGFTGGLNFYCYADGNPISNIDPLGLDFSTWIGAGTAYSKFGPPPPPPSSPLEASRARIGSLEYKHARAPY
jgi:RHS repeat-associated protein